MSAVPFLRKDKRALAFHPGFLATAVANFLLTDYDAGPDCDWFFRKTEMESSRLVQEGSMSDPADVTKDGYDALIAGDDKVVSGVKIKCRWR